MPLVLHLAVRNAIEQHRRDAADARHLVLDGEQVVGGDLGGLAGQLIFAR